MVIEGQENIPRSAGYIVISNHLTYLDGVLLGSVFPVIYLSKKAIKKWPVINWMVSISGTIFIDRSRKSASPKSVDEIVQRLQQRANVLFFPEGTSTDGDKLKDFQSVLFAAPLACQSYIVPVVIRYLKVNNQPVTRLNRHTIYWWGQIPFQNHLYQLLRIKTIDVQLKILPPIKTKGFQDSSVGRKELAHYAHEVIARECDSRGLSSDKSGTH